MSFEDLYYGKIVKFNPRLVREVEHDPYLLGKVLDDESYSCILHINKVNGYSATFSCLSECGKHELDEVCVYDYDQISEKIGGEFFLAATANEYFMTKDVSEPMSIREVYDFELKEETENILEMLARETGG